MRAIVTGGAGFIGSNLVDRLIADGADVTVVDDLSTGKISNLELALGTGNCHFVEADIARDEMGSIFEKARPELVFHLAAQADVRVSVARPAYDAEVNIVGSINVIEASLTAGCRKFVFASSGGTIYGEPESLPVPESAPRRPLNPYGVAKKVVGDYLYYYGEVRDLHYVELALGNIYGPRQDPAGEAGVIAIFCGLLATGNQCTIYGDGEQTRDFVYVSDVVDAFVAAATHGDRELLNIGTGKGTSVNKLYEELAREFGVETPAVYAPPRTGELLHVTLDASRAERVLGWRAGVDIEEGLRRTVEWVRSGSA